VLQQNNVRSDGQNSITVAESETHVYPRYMKELSATMQRGARTLGAHQIKYVREKK